MFSLINRTVFDIPLTWDRTRFESTRGKYRQARKLIANSVNVQFQKQLKNASLENINIEKNINEINESLLKHEKKVYIFDNLKEIASQSLEDHFDKRMELVRANIQEHCNAIQKILQQENEYWKEIYTAIDQNLITSNDIHPATQTTSESSTNNSPISVEFHPSSSTENFVPTKQERLTVVLPSIKSNGILPSVNTTYIVKLEETTNKSLSRESETSPVYSQPNPPAQLYFSPTILQDEQSESLRNILSPVDQNLTNFLRPKVILQRIGQTFLLNHLKTEENNNSYIPSKVSNSDESNDNYENCFVIPESIPPTRKTRKRKQSVSEEVDIKPCTIALRKRKAVPIIEIDDTKPKKKVTKKRKTKKNKENQKPIREPSPLPIIDRSKHYTTRFSTHSRRITFDTDDDDNNESKSYSTLRKKTIKAARNKKR